MSETFCWIVNGLAEGTSAQAGASATTGAAIASPSVIIMVPIAPRRLMARQPNQRGGPGGVGQVNGVEPGAVAGVWPAEHRAATTRLAAATNPVQARR